MKSRYWIFVTLPILACGKSNVTGPSPIESPITEISTPEYINLREYWSIDVGEVWHFTKDGDPSMHTDIATVEDANGCKALHFVKNNINTYHAIGASTNNLWHIQERADGLYANNCKGGFEKDDYPDAQRFDMNTGRNVLTTWFTGTRPYFIAPWIIRNGDSVHGMQCYWVRPASGAVERPCGMWHTRYKLHGDKLTILFDEDSFNIAEDWTFQRGEGLIMIERWMSQDRKQIKARILR